MYQTVGHDVIDAYAACVGVPLFRRELRGTAVTQDSEYRHTEGDEVEDLLQLLVDVKTAIPDMQAVSSGAILSDYQRVRVEHVCRRLDLIPLAYLWRCDQRAVLQQMEQVGLQAVLIKVAAMGLAPKHLGSTTTQLMPYLFKLNDQFGLHVAGEGGEYESLVLDCPLFCKRIIIDEPETVIHSNDGIMQVAYLRVRRYHLEDKPTSVADQMSAILNQLPLAKQPPLREVLPAHAEVSLNESAFVPSAVQFTVSTESKAPVLPSPVVPQWRHVFVSDHSGESSWDSLLQTVHTALTQCTQQARAAVFVAVFSSRLQEEFAEVNAAFQQVFPSGPPARTAVACCPNADGAPVRAIEVLICDRPKRLLHVQSISHWAPACIGPYAQANIAHGLALMAGQIGLNPPRMTLFASELEQTQAAVRHVRAVLQALGLDVQHLLLCDVYLSNGPKQCDVVGMVRQLLASSVLAVMNVITVSQLPRGACVELHPIATSAVQCTVAQQGNAENASQWSFTPASLVYTRSLFCTTDQIDLAHWFRAVSAELAEVMQRQAQPVDTVVAVRCFHVVQVSAEQLHKAYQQCFAGWAQMSCVAVSAINGRAAVVLEVIASCEMVSEDED
eukprot:TRINITY_DN5488_c0_g1_i1.p1 TRINITY_DN5488_c0_g1~~TRINITY_DN5488_c0_g1_i1.p1  ORF type:complete len:614 (-),score=150.96 TRINITY_DN5488_c0_g1_i1:641-2482(-)